MNLIVKLQTEAMVVEGLEEIQEEFKNHFARRFLKTEVIRPNIEMLEFKNLSQEESRKLEEGFYKEGIKEVVFENDRDKSPDPDRFNLEFLKRSWEIVSGDVISFVHEFHNLGKLPKVMTSSFLALVPKCDNPKRLENYRSIYLIG